MSHDTWIHRIVRAAVRPLARTAITPNHVTTARLVTGVAAAACFAIGSTTWTWAGAALFVVSMLCDRADGELARLTGKGSPGGHEYDLVTDGICDAIVLLGVGIGARDGALGVWAIGAGAAAATAVAAIFVTVVTAERRLGHGTIVFASHAGFDPDDAMVIIPIVMCLGWGDVLVAAAGICAPLAAAIIVPWAMARLRAGAGDDSASASHPHQARERPQEVDRGTDTGEHEEAR